VHGGRHVAGRRRRDHAVEHVADQLGVGVAEERAPAVQPFVERDAEAELIGARVGGLGAVLLRRHVGRSSQHRAGVSQRHRERAFLGRRMGRPLSRHRRVHQPEVDHAHAAVARQEHVVRLEVAVGEPGPVGGLQTAPGLDEHVDHLAPRPARRLQPLAQRAAVVQLHDEEDLVLDGADLVHGDDVGMRQARHRLRLAQEASARLLPAQAAARPRTQDLERHLAVEQRIVRDVHDAHPARADPVQHHEARQAVAPGEHVGVDRILSLPPGAGPIGRCSAQAAHHRIAVVGPHDDRRYSSPRPCGIL
jgi:hypothetical protein